MVVIGLLTCPMESTRELAESFLDLPPSPDYIHLKGNYCYAEKDKGMQNIIIWEVERGRMADAIESLTSRWVRIYAGIPGISFSVIPGMDLEESLRMHGLLKVRK